MATTRRQRPGASTAVGGLRAPVVADDDGPVVAAESLVQGDGVLGQGAGLVAAVGWYAGGRVAAGERRY
jgi:hypothetical protein